MDPRFKELRQSVETEALEKLEKIKENILTGGGKSDVEHVQILMMVIDELDDVLLNWKNGSFSAITFKNPISDDFEDDDDDY